MKYFIVNGSGGAGKDTFVKFCQDLVAPGMSLNISTVDDVKAVAKTCGWDGGKSNKDRAFLSGLKQLLHNYNDFPHRMTLKRIEEFQAYLKSYDQNTENAVVFIHCREPEAIERLKKELDATTVLIRRPSLENLEYGNASDDGVERYDYDYTINNDGTLDDLRHWAIAFLAINNIEMIYNI